MLRMLKFRNIDADPKDPVATWPTEGFIAALERGQLPDWSRIAVAVEEDPWGPAARRIEEALKVSRPYGVAVLMERTLAQARADAELSERAEVARRVRALVDAAGTTQAAFAEAIGTSASRLSTYLSGQVVPSAALLVRMERAALRISHSREPNEVSL